MKAVLALDQGTTSSRAIAFGRDGALHEAALKRYANWMAIAEIGLPLLLFYLYEAAGGISYPPQVLAELLMRCASARKYRRRCIGFSWTPKDGFIVWGIHAARRLGLVGDGGIIRYLDLARRGALSAICRGDLDSQSS